MTGFSFAERMAGEATVSGEDHRFAFSMQARSPTRFRPWGLTVAETEAILDVEGLADSVPARGWLELAPFSERRMRYVLDFTGDDGRAYRFDAVKRIRPWSLRSWTVLRGEIRSAGGELWGPVVARFSLSRQLLGLVTSVRAWRPAAAGAARREELVARRWRGRRGRLEVWYATLTDPETGEGFWLHHELVAPHEGEPRRHGWAAAFPADAPPVAGRFAGELGDGAAVAGPGVPAFSAGDVVVRPGALTGSAGPLRWDLTFDDDADPLFTFPEAAWRRELLPAAQIVPAPTARFTGTISVGDRRVELCDAPGNLARIYGHGNAERWGWLHADLGRGDVLEIVAAVSRRPGLRRLPPLTFVQLRLGGEDWPARPLLAAPVLRTELRRDGFTTKGRWGSRRLHVEVRLPPERTLTLDYDDPDGDGPTCSNSERASAEIALGRRGADGRWRVDSFSVLGTAHAEVGRRG